MYILPQLNTKKGNIFFMMNEFLFRFSRKIDGQPTKALKKSAVLQTLSAMRYVGVLSHCIEAMLSVTRQRSDRLHTIRIVLPVADTLIT